MTETANSGVPVSSLTPRVNFGLNVERRPARKAAGTTVVITSRPLNNKGDLFSRLAHSPCRTGATTAAAAAPFHVVPVLSSVVFSIPLCRGMAWQAQMTGAGYNGRETRHGKVYDPLCLC
ncbi:hypothetical protein AAFF_G00233410 [Aldrovandia affinis]|uniref:Uncharacterized protein n=1 Tax=Aldrovandia affinis TaxID=143900 RepID=A0AAD7W4U7_9TELE|nr:hypothetical protein AAFF_G00233410 [Aldrovandia affinis]